MLGGAARDSGALGDNGHGRPTPTELAERGDGGVEQCLAGGAAALLLRLADVQTTS
jgi:hypothetical protein